MLFPRVQDNQTPQVSSGFIIPCGQRICQCRDLDTTLRLSRSTSTWHTARPAGSASRSLTPAMRHDILLSRKGSSPRVLCSRVSQAAQRYIVRGRSSHRSNQGSSLVAGIVLVADYRTMPRATSTHALKRRTRRVMHGGIRALAGSVPYVGTAVWEECP
jgi:hypothetical protein